MKYDFALSFATEDEKLVEKVYHYLRAEGWSRLFFLRTKDDKEIIFHVRSRK